MANTVRVWDLPIRIFHWSLVGLVVFSFVTGKIGGTWLTWHMRSGYAILALLLFRLAWGFVGSDTARFARFLRGPRAVLAHARELVRGRMQLRLGHNPMGAWMVLAMLLVLGVQAASGLFTDDEIATQGPLAVKVSNAWVARMSRIHHFNQWVVAGMAAVHVVAVAIYQWGLRTALIGPMWSGNREFPEPFPAPREARIALAAALAAAAGILVYLLVVVYPGRP